MASILKRGDSYSVRYKYKDHSGKPCEGWESFKTKKEAQERKITVEKELLDGTFLVPDTMTVEEMLYKWIPIQSTKHKWSPKTYTQSVAMVQNLIVPYIGKRKVQELRTYDIEKFYATLAKTPCGQYVHGVKQPLTEKQKKRLLSSTSIHEVHTLLKTAFSYAVEWDLIHKIPLPRDAPKVNIEERTIWDEKTMLAALQTIENPALHLAVHMSMILSLREGEILGLQCFPLFFLRNIKLSKFHQPESDEILIEAGLLQFFICDFYSQLIFLAFQRFQTLFRCPGVQAVLYRLHQVVQLFVDLSQLLFQQRDRCVLLILDIHDQLNDLVDHRIVLNQLHGLPNNQIFQPVLLHGLFVAALTPLDVGAFIIIVGAPGSTGSAFAEHQRTAFAAEQLGGQQIFLVCFATGRGTLVLIHTLLHPVKKVFRNDSRNRIRHNDIPERQFTNVTTVLQHGVHAAVGHFCRPAYCGHPCR